MYGWTGSRARAMVFPAPRTDLRTYWFTTWNSFSISSNFLSDSFVPRLAPANFEKDCANHVSCVRSRALTCDECLRTSSTEAEDALR